MPTYTASANDDGNSDLVLGTWIGGAAQVQVDQTKWAGWRFQVHTLFDTENRPIAPPIFRSLSLGVTIVGAAPAGTFNIYYVDESAPAVFSNTRRPGSGDLTEVLVGSVVFTGAETGAITISLNMVPIYARYNHSAWNGWLAFTGEENVAAVLTLTSAEGAGGSTLVTDELPNITGIRDGNETRKHGQVERCPVCGFLTTRDQMVPDGYREGSLICPDCWDPPDPTRDHSPRLGLDLLGDD
jgi:hypothetical protein